MLIKVNPKRRKVEGIAIELHQRMSVPKEDRWFLDMTKREIHIANDGHYKLPLPFRSDDVVLAGNRKLAESQLSGLQSKFGKDVKYKNDYVNFINDIAY